MKWFGNRRRRHDELICAIKELTQATRWAPYNAHENAPEQIDYTRQLKKLADVSQDVQGAAELLARWLALQLPPEATRDVPIPEDWRDA